MRPSVVERFWAKVNKTNACWLWVGTQQSAGYGQLRVGGRRVLAHRFAYELLVGPIPPGLQIDHLCRVRNCVNTDHLEPVTNLENTQRGEAGRYWSEKTHCPQGHPYDTENTSLYKGGRYCRACHRASGRARTAARRKALAQAAGGVR